MALLLEATGLSLGRIRAEVDKLVLYAAGESAVTERHIRDLVMPEHEPGEGLRGGQGDLERRCRRRACARWRRSSTPARRR